MFRVWRAPDEKVNATDVLKLSIIRLLRIRRTLDKYHTAEEILQLLKDLQIKYSKSNNVDTKVIVETNTAHMERIMMRMELKVLLFLYKCTDWFIDKRSRRSKKKSRD